MNVHDIKIGDAVLVPLTVTCVDYEHGDVFFELSPDSPVLARSDDYMLAGIITALAEVCIPFDDVVEMPEWNYPYEGD